MKYNITHKYEIVIEKLFKKSEAINIHLGRKRDMTSDMIWHIRMIMK